MLCTPAATPALIVMNFQKTPCKPHQIFAGTGLLRLPCTPAVYCTAVQCNEVQQVQSFIMQTTKTLLHLTAPTAVA